MAGGRAVRLSQECVEMLSVIVNKNCNKQIKNEAIERRHAQFIDEGN